MCGLCGVVGPAERAGAGDVEGMGRALEHRGPDDFGTWRHRIEGPGGALELALAHARLSILDLSPAGHQPMTSADGGVTVAYNGEIYNFRALRGELEARGHAFCSSSDTEVLIEAWRAWGAEALERLNGMFAFALWDEGARRLVLARDRLGIKPLYYRDAEGVLSFASELRALRRHRAFRAEIDRGALGGYVRHGYVPGPQSIYAGVRRLLPGEMLVWSPEAGAETRRWWRLEALEPEPPPEGFEATVDALEARLGDAVEDRLVSDVPLGAFLSGGIDSSTVAALMRERARGPVRTFSIGFRDAAYDEAPHARAVAEHLKTEHTELYVDAEQAREVARELPELFDEPFADASAIPTVLLARLTRRHVTVALSGDGGDELFGGYHQYARLGRLHGALRLPRALRAAVASASRALPPGGLRNALGHLRSADAAELAYRLVSGAEPGTLAALCGPAAAAPSAIHRETFEAAAAARGPVRAAMLADARLYLPDDILTKVDRATMSVALEARVPLLDPRVVRLALSLPLETAWRGGRTKAPLRALLHRRVPPELVERPKQGFALPLGRLLGRDLEAWRQRHLDPQRLRAEGLLAPEGVARLLAEARRRGGEHAATVALWRLVCFQRWWAHQRGEPTG